MAKMIDPAQNLHSLKPTVLVVGHGPAVPDPTLAMTQPSARAGGARAPRSPEPASDLTSGFDAHSGVRDARCLR